MNILFCGDKSIEDGLIIAIVSILKNTEETLHIYILTMRTDPQNTTFSPLSQKTASFLDEYVKKKDPENSVTLTDITDLFTDDPPAANMDTRFTPYCMLRLYIDEIEGMPDRILYLDSDVIVRRSIENFYHQDMEGWEVSGSLDYWGKWFFRTSPFHMDYINSGVMLINLKMIRETGLFAKCREMCRDKQMFMPDQSAINKLSQAKKICSGKYNEQRKLRKDTVIQHFTTGFRFFPILHTFTVKPWEIEQVHKKLRLTEYDDILGEYQVLKTELERKI